jgi:hypothetical protein
MSVRSLRYSGLSLRLPKGSSALPIERDAWAFLDAAGITSALQQRAVVQLVRDLKKANLWTKMKAIYPFVGGTATTHKWNLKDSRDTDAAFHLTFNGGWTHSDTGADPNGTTAYANTWFQPSTNESNTNAHRCIYLRENTDELKFDMADFALNTLNNGSFILARSSNTFYGRITADTNVTTANTDSKGCFIVTRSDASNASIAKNDAAFVTAAQNNSALNTNYAYISASSNLANGDYFSSREVAFASIGEGFSQTESRLLYQCVDRYQKTLGRAV